jgi:hypothetical protein
MLPDPLAARPIEGVSLTQLKLAPAVPAKVTSAVDAPLHTVWFAVALTTGVGFTVIVKLVVLPVHDPYKGVTVIVATTGTAPALMPVNAAMLPVPLAARPIEGVSLTQV